MILEGLCFYFNKLHFYLQIPIFVCWPFVRRVGFNALAHYALCTMHTESCTCVHDVHSVWIPLNSGCVVTAAMSFSYVHQVEFIKQSQYTIKCNTSFECIQSGRENLRSRTCLFIYIYIYIGNLYSAHTYMLAHFMRTFYLQIRF